MPLFKLLISAAFHCTDSERGSPCPHYEDTRGMEVHFRLFFTSVRDCLSGKIRAPGRVATGKKRRAHPSDSLSNWRSEKFLIPPGN